MSTPSRPSLQRQARALGDATRYAIFRHIAESSGPVGVADLNARFPLNHNAIRQHLAKLVDAAMVVETQAPPGGPGRPRLLYAVAPGIEGHWGTTGPYERLSGLLVEIIRSGLEPEEVGRQAADQFRVPSPSGDAVVDMSAAMARQGFDPEVRERRRGAEVVLRQCPFASAAIADRQTVCALHLGIAEGLAEGSDVSVDKLVAYDPRKAQCRIELVADADVDDAHLATLTLRAMTPRKPAATARP